jgi:hypothetical protein
MENQKRNFKTEKKGSKMNGEKRNVKKGKKLGKNGEKWGKMGNKWGKHGFVHLHFFACILLFRFFLFFSRQKKNTINAKKTANRENKKMQTKCKCMDKSIFSHFCISFLFSPFFSPFILLLCFLDFADLLFGFSFFLLLLRFFSSFKKLE